MIDKLLLKIRERYNFSDEEELLLQAVMTETVSFDRGAIIVRESEPVGFSSLLIEGISCRSKYLEDGSRQIMEFNLPGDFVDLHSYPLEWLDHDVLAVTPCKIVKLPHKKITEIVKADSRMGRIFWFSTMVDASIHREWLVSLGRRSALERVAHFFCEIFYRLRVVGMIDGVSYNLSITQTELGEALGLTGIHINRKLKELRERGLMTFQNRKVVIEDLEGLESVAGFNPGYLFLEPRTE